MKWDGEINIYCALICHYIIMYAFNNSNRSIHLFCIYVANFIKIHRTVSEINVFKTWHLKSPVFYGPLWTDFSINGWMDECDLSNIARASSLLPKSRSVSEHYVTTG